MSTIIHLGFTSKKQTEIAVEALNAMNISYRFLASADDDVIEIDVSGIRFGVEPSMRSSRSHRLRVYFGVPKGSGYDTNPSMIEPAYFSMFT